jgi:hypothetical protein
MASLARPQTNPKPPIITRIERGPICATLTHLRFVRIRGDPDTPRHVNCLNDAQLLEPGIEVPDGGQRHPSGCQIR